MIRWCSILLVFSVLFAAAAASAPRNAPVVFTTSSQAEAPVPVAPVTVILVRHAEKATDGDARDPKLSEAGTKRAESLARMLGSAGVTHLFATEFHRTQDTLAPLAKVAGHAVDVVPAGKAEELEKCLRALAPGSVAVVAGHSNTVPDVAKRLGVALEGLQSTRNGATLAEDSFDRVFVLTLPPAGSNVAPRAIELRY